MRGVVHVGDCLEWLRSLPDESVDAVVTDPPYGLGKEPDPREVLSAWLAGDEFKPGGSGFMGRAWDAFVPSPVVWAECFRVLKPGGHLLAFAGTRTYDWIVLGVRLAGFEIRDMLSWVYSTGFPKSLNLSRAIDAANYCQCGGDALPCAHEHYDQKAEHDMRPVRGGDVPQAIDARAQRRQVLQSRVQEQGAPTNWSACAERGHDGRTQPCVEGRHVHRAGEGVPSCEDAVASPGAGQRVCVGAHTGGGADAGAPADGLGGRASHQPRPGRQQAGEPQGVREPPRALGVGAPAGHHRCEDCGGLRREYMGYGTAAKPSVEPIVMARKPLSGTVAANVLEHGTGAINVDGCRVETDEKYGRGGERERVRGYVGIKSSAMIPAMPQHTAGRWPANLIHDGSDEVVGLFPQTGKSPETYTRSATARGEWLHTKESGTVQAGFGDTGSAARFFYQAKATRREREAGLEHLPRGIVDPTRAEDSAGRDNPRTGAGRKGGGRANVHPTVKPVALMRWLVRLVTPPGGLVIDPYLGSGTTGMAAAFEGVEFQGCELDTWHAVIAHERIAWARCHPPSDLGDGVEDDEDGDDEDVVPMQAALPLGG